MKALPFKIPKPGFENLIYQEDQEFVFYNQLHQHQEIQLSYIAKGSGTLLIADSVYSFKDGDVFVIGSNVPHVFKTDEPASTRSLMKTLFFDRNSFGSKFFELEETSELQLFFEKSRSGLKVLRPNNQLHQHFDFLSKASRFERFIGLLNILNELNKADCEVLSSVYEYTHLSSSEGERLRNVFEYTTNNYQSHITLEQIADVANMTKTAFCKYFKRRTNKTYNEFLNSYRVEMVIKKRERQKDATIAEIAYDCGFGSVSNFNKVFKKLKGTSLRSYKINA